MKKAVIGVTPLWDRDRDSCWMLPGYLEGLELAGALPITLSLTEDAGGISQLVYYVMDVMVFSSPAGRMSPRNYTVRSLV